MATEQLVQLYVKALIKKGCNQITLIETLDEVNQHVLDMLKVTQPEKVTSTRAEKTQPEKVGRCLHEYKLGGNKKGYCGRGVITGTNLCKFHTTAVKHTIQVMLGETHTTLCNTILKSGKNKNKKCDKYTLPGEDVCKVHYILKK